MGSQERIMKIIVKQTGAKKDDVKIESILIDDLGCDELDMIEIAMALEEEFNIEITEKVMDTKCKTVQDIADYIDGKR